MGFILVCGMSEIYIYVYIYIFFVVLEVGAHVSSLSNNLQNEGTSLWPAHSDESEEP